MGEMHRMVLFKKYKEFHEYIYTLYVIYNNINI